MFLFWIWSLHQHARNRLSGVVMWSLLLPMLAAVVALAGWYLGGQLNESNLYYLSIIDDCRLYSGLLFDVWQMWSYVLFFDNAWHFLLNLVFFLPLMFYWERHFKIWFPLALCVLLPTSVFLIIMLAVTIPGLGTSPLIYALCGGLLLFDRGMRAELVWLRWWGTRISLRKQSVLLTWVLLVFAISDIGRQAWASQDLLLLAVYVGNALLAVCAGAVVFRLLSQIQRRLELTAS